MNIFKMLQCVFLNNNPGYWASPLFRQSSLFLLSGSEGRGRQVPAMFLLVLTLFLMNTSFHTNEISLVNKCKGSDLGNSFIVLLQSREKNCSLASFYLN